MLDIKFIRKNPELVKKCIIAKGEKTDLDEIMYLDSKKRTLQFEYDQYKADQNRYSKEIPKFKKNGKDVSDLIPELQDTAKKVKETSRKLTKISAKLESELLKVPNIFDDSVPIGKSDEDNVVIKEYGKKSQFDFESLNHIELSEKLQLIDFRHAAKIAGSGFVCYINKGA
ncbi:MAG: serine--tRNA ligase, partial [Candidatus Cloacimonadota bacterium]|nr:serine--tRNA ligase [Candidatus Cloacimonadota bacterium]